MIDSTKLQFSHVKVGRVNCHYQWFTPRRRIIEITVGNRSAICLHEPATIGKSNTCSHFSLVVKKKLAAMLVEQRKESGAWDRVDLGKENGGFTQSWGPRIGESGNGGIDVVELIELRRGDWFLTLAEMVRKFVPAMIRKPTTLQVMSRRETGIFMSIFNG